MVSKALIGLILFIIGIFLFFLGIALLFQGINAGVVIILGILLVGIGFIIMAGIFWKWIGS
ncbi:hypothetical protein FJZ19_02420 [Candidatus Pacearchaeota archaeon]|nr:hypothetical protein [Candidatus Pacearchaeota archaeon]